MSALYEKCSLCAGTRLTREPMTVSTGTGPAVKPAGTDCPCVRSGTPGFCPSGLTAGQVDAILRDRDRLLVALADLSAAAADAPACCEQRRRLLEGVASLVRGRSAEVLAARFRLGT